MSLLARSRQLGSNSFLFFETLNYGSQPVPNRFFDQVKFENLQRVTRILLHVGPPAQYKRCAQASRFAASLVTRQGDGHHTREPLEGWILSCAGQGLLSTMPISDGDSARTVTVC